MTRVVLLFLLTGWLISCSTKENKTKENVTKHTGVEAIMISKSGELFEGNMFLPLPLNHAFVSNSHGDSLDILILGLPIDDKMTFFHPFALIDLMEGGVKRPFVIGLPELEKHKVLESNDFSDFMIKNHAIKNIIDTYFANYQGLGKTRISRWQDGFRAEALIKSFNDKQLSTNEG